MVPKRRKDRTEETRLKLVAAGAAVFARQGLAGARIADIAKEAGVAMGTLYTHFKDKEALFEEVMRVGKDVVLAGLAASREVDGGRAAIDRAAMEGVVIFAEIYGALFRLLLSRGAADNAMQREVVDAIVELRVEELQQGMKDGWVREGLDVESAARCEVGAVFHLLDWWLDDPSQLDRDALIDRLSAFRRFGVEGRPA
ncbi:TetR/AcrR family transcriptional regulator [Maricaulaceae bacterium NA33B04]|nr:TetR/AcrR family transcriptional regulator [Maricaulaceae bacterium NA33B04]